jgi:imidazolonepropionase-like amidohydrolase
VVVDDGRIQTVGRTSDLGEPNDEAQLVDYSGCTILPGLIDCHVHLVFSAGPRPLDDLLAEDDDGLLLCAVHNAQTALRAGVTTVKDLGARGGVSLRLREAIARGILPGPRILAAGPPITSTRGHCYWLGGEADTSDQLRLKVGQIVKQGADLIKVMATGGRMTAGSNVCAAQYTLEQLRALVREARALGKTVAAHAHGVAGIRNAVAAGVNVVEHCSWVSPVATNRVEYDERVAEEMARMGTFVDPTLSPLALKLDRDPASLTPGQRESREIRPEVLAAHRRTIELGVEIAAGTDAGVAETPFDSLRHEIRFLSDQLGLSAAKAIQAATYNAARAVAAQDDVGSIQSGRRADLLIVDGNPLDDLEALGRVRAVYKDGILEVENGRLVRS